jgi:hypothetical protein
MNQLLWGALFGLSVVTSAFFWKFWKRTRDRLFLAFSGGFGVLSVHWVALGIANPLSETRHYLYVLRFLAFALIIAGVVAKNRSGSTRSKPAPMKPGS